MDPALNVKQTSEWYPGNKLFYTELYVPAQNSIIQTEIKKHFLLYWTVKKHILEKPYNLTLNDDVIMYGP